MVIDRWGNLVEVAENARFEQRANFRAAILDNTVLVTDGSGSGGSLLLTNTE